MATVKDHGRGFDVARFDPEVPPDPLLDHGRGLYIVARLMDSLELRLDGGLEVHMTRRAEPRCEPAALESGLGDACRRRLDQRERAPAPCSRRSTRPSSPWTGSTATYTPTRRRCASCRRLARNCLAARSGSSSRSCRAPLQEHYRQAMELGRPSVFEDRSVVGGDWLEVRIYPTPVGISVYFREINERKRAETRTA